MGDRDAVNQIRLGSLIESLPELHSAIGDCAYTPSKHLDPIIRGDMARNVRNDNFIFCKPTQNSNRNGVWFDVEEVGNSLTTSRYQGLPYRAIDRCDRTFT